MLDDVDPKKAAADAAYACFSATGPALRLDGAHLRHEGRRRRVHRRRSPSASQALKIGSAFDYSTDIGSLTTAAQLERVTAHLDDAVAKGATVLAGGKARPDLGPYFFEPTVLTNVTSDMDCFGDETFGALVAVTVVDDEEEAVAAANDSEYGLNASVFSGSRSRGREVAARHRRPAASTSTRATARASAASTLRWAALKQSGLGRRNGPEGLLRFIESRTISEATGLLTAAAHGPASSRSSSARCCCCCAR